MSNFPKANKEELKLDYTYSIDFLNDVQDSCDPIYGDTDIDTIDEILKAAEKLAQNKE